MFKEIGSVPVHNIEPCEVECACVKAFGNGLLEMYGTQDVMQLLREGWIEFLNGYIIFYADLGGEHV